MCSKISNCVLFFVLPLLASSFSLPTTFTLDPLTGLVFVGQQTGEIFATRFNTTTTPTLVKVVPAFSFDWHGLTSLHVSPTHLYATYTTSVGTGSTCADDGNSASMRVPSSVLGCPHYGVLVRWAYTSSTGALAADPPESIITPNTVCSQFGSNGIDQIIPAQIPNTFYVSTGAGALDVYPSGGTDYGQYGNRPCTSSPGNPWAGHFQALDPGTANGKVMFLDLANTTTPTPTLTLFASGFHNPWRMTFAAVPSTSQGSPPPIPSLYLTDTGGMGALTDEVNGPITRGSSWGWPCLSGTAPVPQFRDLPFSPCASSSLPTQSPPLWTTPPRPANLSSSLSALEWHPVLRRWFGGDALRGIVFSFTAFGEEAGTVGFGAITIHSKFTYAVQLMYVSPAALVVSGAGGLAPALGAMMVVDVGTGNVKEVPPIFTPTPTSGASRPTLGWGGGGVMVGVLILATTLLIQG